MILPGENDQAVKRANYACDITYGTNNEFGFDYLRDNMALSLEEKVQRGHNYAIVDEVDSILIDEARTPLIISGRVSDAAKLYYKFASVARSLTRDVDYEVDEEKRIVFPLPEGIEKVEQSLGVENLYDDVSTSLVHQLNVAIKAKELYRKDRDYLIQNGEVKIVDEFTGRVLEGRRWSEGLHQAVEAKEGVKIKEENQTLATVTLQNYFRMYDKLAGMTGTALTEAAEFMSTYELQVVPIPTHRPLARKDDADLIYRTEDAKFAAAVDDIAERNAKGQPVLVGTVSVEKSERLARELEKRGIRHEVLNAKQHSREAEIVTQAGRIGAVTVATNMAGRGVDILLGGNPEGMAERELNAEQLMAVGDGTADGVIDVESLDEAAERRYQELAREVQRRVQGRGREGPRARRPVRAGHRAPREPSHRQPAPWPRRPPGRPGREPLLPVARGRPHALLRDGRDRVGHGQGLGRRRPDRGEDGLQGHREGTEHRRGAQRGDPQERAQVRRGHERAAQGDLPAPRRGARRRRPALRDAARRSPRRSTRLIGTHASSDFNEEWDRDALIADTTSYWPTSLAADDLMQATSSDGLYDLLMTDATRHYEERETEIGDERMRSDRAPGDAQGHRRPLAGPPQGDGPPPGGHQPACARPEGPAVGVAA